MQYDADRHSLLRDIAHRAELPPDRYAELEAAVTTAGIEVETAQIPDWPPVPYSDLAWILFGGDGPWWKKRHWAGEQPVIARDRRGDARRIAREMAGPHLSPARLAYVWQCEAYDPAEHVIMRSWLAEHEVDIVEFLRQYLPKAEAEAGRRLLVEVANPLAAAEAAVGSFSPTRRALRIADLHVLEGYAAATERFTYEAEQAVSWVRAEDGSRWEARRTHAPQSRTWASHRSWISRPLGSGATRDDDVDAVDGWRFGPCMELFDDGAISLWIEPRAESFVRDNPIVINGVTVRFELESINKITGRCSGQVPPDQMEQILAGASRPAAAEAEQSDEGAVQASEPVALNGVRFRRVPRKPFAHPVTPLPATLHRAGGRSPMTLREPNEVRWWGEPSIADRGLRINGHDVAHIEPWNKGWRGRVDSIQRVIEDGLSAEPPTPTPEPRPSGGSPPTPEPRPAGGAVTAGMRTYSAAAVLLAINVALGRNVRLFGRSVSDQAVTALTREGLLQFLAEDTTDRINYIADNGGRNFDCENFSELMRVNLARKHGVNSCAVVWGDGHAWCAFAVVGDGGPEIVMVEPQSDEWVEVEELTGNYSVERRAEVLL